MLEVIILCTLPKISTFIKLLLFTLQILTAFEIILSIKLVKSVLDIFFFL